MANVQEVAVLAQLRQARILGEVRSAGAVRVGALAAALGVSDMTVRRDLDTLARKGLLAKVHGGATLASEALLEPAFDIKALREPAAKEAIARRAAALIRPGMAVAITAGTTAWMVVRQLLDLPDLTVVTTSMKAAETLQRSPRADRTVVLTGGVRTPSDGLVGPLAVQAIHSLRFDVAVMGAHSLDAAAGLTTPNLLEAETNRAVAASARRLVVVADHTKWRSVSLASIVALSAIDTLVTDDGWAADALAELRTHVPDVLLAAATHRPQEKA